MSKGAAVAVKEAEMVRVADLPSADQSARIRLRSWIQVRSEGRDNIQIPELAHDALEHFLADDSFIRALVREKLPAMVYDEAKRLFSSGRTRSHIEPLNEPPRGGVAASKSRWHRWFEHVGDRHIRLTAMTRLDFDLAIAERQGRVGDESVTIRHWKLLRDGMETDWETVGQRFSEAEIDAALEAAQGVQ